MREVGHCLEYLRCPWQLACDFLVYGLEKRPLLEHEAKVSSLDAAICSPVHATIIFEHYSLETR